MRRTTHAERNERTLRPVAVSHTPSGAGRDTAASRALQAQHAVQKRGAFELHQQGPPQGVVVHLKHHHAQVPRPAIRTADTEVQTGDFSLEPPASACGLRSA